jgi:hypothetical protein
MNVDNIPFYNILNMVFIGILFAVGLFILTPEIFVLKSIPFFESNEFLKTAVVVVVIYYVGFFIDRTGSLLIEKILKNKNQPSKRNFVSQKIQMNWRNYDEYQRAEKSSEHIKVLAREYTFSRNSMTLFLILTIIAIFVGNWVFCSFTWFATIFLYFSLL